MGTLILSGLQHPLSHFMAQLHNLRNPRRHSKIKRSLLDVMSALNAKRFATGADNRLKGIQLQKIESTLVFLFTSSPKMSASSLDQFKEADLRNNGSDVFNEAFRWDQNLHTFCFREKLRGATPQPNPTLVDLCKLTGGSYTHVTSFQKLKCQIERLATVDSCFKLQIGEKMC